jgi:SAM-dependent methyltransferase
MLREKDLAYKLKGIAKGKKSILDVGCRYGKTLYPFLDLGFDYLHGIDNQLTLENYMAFYFARYKFEYASSAKSNYKRPNDEFQTIDLSKKRPNHSICFNWPSIYSEFKQIKLDIGEPEGNVLTCEFERKYDVIIAKDILHFFKQDQRLVIVEKLIAALKPSGFIYVFANSKERMPKYGKNMNKATKLNDKTYREELNSKRTYYLLDQYDFKEIGFLFDKCLSLKVNEKEDRLGEEIIGQMK